MADRIKRQIGMTTEYLGGLVFEHSIGFSLHASMQPLRNAVSGKGSLTDSSCLRLDVNSRESGPDYMDYLSICLSVSSIVIQS